MDLESRGDAERKSDRAQQPPLCDLCFAVYAQVSSHLSVTVYVEDINDHAPQFVDAPYHVTVDELTPVGEIQPRVSDIVNRCCRT
jgi:hypothetical protein